ncbi:SPFH domain-containing protein [Thermomonospora catenispora]|uniref:SPFH domain-containing protein n=1 Tax=Thermomonospora catenispora TaxID=2493090 RepID=UPI0011220061|nr:SPFH domain-containing protein [Thermomonospora catenispora]TNY34589.1 hypothetical protein EIO00_23015 [Thermomonospora catenispora]
MTGGLVAGGVDAGGPPAQPPTDPFAAGPPSGAVLAVTVLVAAVIAAAATVRVVPGHRRLVRWRLGGAPTVRGPGVVWILPGIDRWELVRLRTAPLELWAQASTRDGVVVHLKIVAVMSIADPDRYAIREAEAPGAACATAGVLVEERVRRCVARRELTRLAEAIAAGDAPLPDEEDDAHLRELEEWGLSVSSIHIARADVPLHGLRRWAARSAPPPGGPDRP